MQNARLTRDDVARAALRILDELGLPDLTMRRLAAELNVRPSALYWHFPNKQTLLADLADRIVTRRHPAESASGWDGRLRAEAFVLRDALLAYRDSAEIVSSSLALGLGENPAHARLRQALDSSPFDAESADRAATTMLHFLLGHVSLEQQRLQYDSLGARSGEPVTLESHEGDFRFGVDILIAGLRDRASADSPAPS
ncbi:TetR family transcriptional regulator [Brachybacterium sp. AOP43-C2-M15]|uniref:TetR family transcriptional regulator n=1 Tax=Brachybacterium sp. AOP43-C2-M15 TaxID=3457661 RepID=UPI004033877D